MTPQNQPFNSWKWLDLQFSKDLCYDAFDRWTSEPQVSWVTAETCLCVLIDLF